MRWPFQPFAAFADSVGSYEVPRWAGSGTTQVQGIELAGTDASATRAVRFEARWWTCKTISLWLLAAQPETITASLGSIRQAVVLRRTARGSRACWGRVEFAVSPLQPEAVERQLLLSGFSGRNKAKVWLVVKSHEAGFSPSGVAQAWPAHHRLPALGIVGLSRLLVVSAAFLLALVAFSQVIPGEVQRMWATVSSVFAVVLGGVGLSRFRLPALSLDRMEHALFTSTVRAWSARPPGAGGAAARAPAGGAKGRVLAAWGVLLACQVAILYGAAQIFANQYVQFQYTRLVKAAASARPYAVAPLLQATCLVPERPEARLLISANIHAARSAVRRDPDAFRKVAKQVADSPGLRACVGGTFDFQKAQARYEAVAVSDPLHWYAGLLLDADPSEENKRAVVRLLRTRERAGAPGEPDPLTELLALAVEGEYEADRKPIVAAMEAQWRRLEQRVLSHGSPQSSHVLLEVLDRLGQHYMANADYERMSRHFAAILAERMKHRHPPHTRWDRPPEKLFLYHLAIAKAPPGAVPSVEEYLPGAVAAWGNQAFESAMKPVKAMAPDFFADSYEKASEAWLQGALISRSHAEVSAEIANSLQKGWPTW